MTKKTPKISRHQELGGLQDLLLKACPPDDKGRVSIPHLAGKLNLSSTSVYNWIAANRVPSRRVKSLVKLSKGRITLEEVLPYTLG